MPVTYLATLISLLRHRLSALRAGERASYTTEMVVTTAIIVGLAIAVGAIVVDRVIARANSIPID